MNTLIEGFRIDCAAILLKVLDWAKANANVTFSPPPKSSPQQRLDVSPGVFYFFPFSFGFSQ